MSTGDEKFVVYPPGILSARHGNSRNERTARVHLFSCARRASTGGHLVTSGEVRAFLEQWNDQTAHYSWLPMQVKQCSFCVPEGVTGQLVSEDGCLIRTRKKGKAT